MCHIQSTNKHGNAKQEPKLEICGFAKKSPVVFLMQLQSRLLQVNALYHEMLGKGRDETLECAS